MVVVLMPINTSIFAERFGSTAWKKLPTYYQVSKKDRKKSPFTEQLFEKDKNARTCSITSGYATLMFSIEIAKLIPLFHPI